MYALATARLVRTPLQVGMPHSRRPGFATLCIGGHGSTWPLQSDASVAAAAGRRSRAVDIESIGLVAQHAGAVDRMAMLSESYVVEPRRFGESESRNIGHISDDAARRLGYKLVEEEVRLAFDGRLCCKDM
jgi:hypothetical protein